MAGFDTVAVGACAAIDANDRVKGAGVEADFNPELFEVTPSVSLQVEMTCVFLVAVGGR
jgi:hypothetical protein